MFHSNLLCYLAATETLFSQCHDGPSGGQSKARHNKFDERTIKKMAQHARVDGGKRKTRGHFFHFPEMTLFFQSSLISKLFKLTGCGFHHQLDLSL